MRRKSCGALREEEVQTASCHSHRQGYGVQLEIEQESGEKKLQKAANASQFSH
jgi:hypothetical protein